jgi:hypothetical protein
MKKSLFVFLDSYIKEHKDCNALLLNHFTKAYSDDLIILNAPFITFFQNQIYLNDIDSIFNLSYILTAGQQIEAIGAQSIPVTSRTTIHSLLTQSKGTDVVDVFSKYSNMEDNELTEILTNDAFDFALIDLSIVLKTSNFSIRTKEKTLFLKFILFYGDLVQIFLNNHINQVNLVVQNSTYSINHLIKKVVEKQQSSVHHRYISYIHDRGRIAAYKIVVNPTVDSFYRRKFADSYGKVELLGRAVNYVFGILSNNVFGSSPFKYSPDSKDLIDVGICDLLDLDDDKQLFVYFTSSPDEELVSDLMQKGIFLDDNNQRKPFSDEFEAISALAEYTMNINTNLIIRFHPRLGVESRVPRESDLYLPFLESVKSLEANYPNVRVVDAYSKISSYWLAGWADTIFSVRSSMGNIAPLLGIPTVLMSDSRGAFVANYDDIIMGDRVFERSSRNFSAFSLYKYCDFVIGYYLTSRHSAFDLVSNQPLDVNIYRKSMDIGYSSLAFIPNGSTDLHLENYSFTSSHHVGTLLEYLINEAKNLSSLESFPMLIRLTSLQSQLGNH